MKPDMESISTDPIKVERSMRPDNKRILTSGWAGEIIPIACIPLLREDAARGTMRVKLDMMETVEMLMNAVNVNVQAWFVPHLAFERFNGMDSLNRSYTGEPEAGGAVIPYFHQVPFNANSDFWKTLGMHGIPGANVNSAYLEAYNVLVNHRRRSRTEKLPERTPYDETLAQAFWHHTNFDHIVPDFDQAMIDGIVPLSFAQSKIPVRGLSRGAAVTGTSYNLNTDEIVSSSNQRFLSTDITQAIPRVFAELQDGGITVSLANIELAKTTAAFAKLRKRFSGLDDDHIIDLLMDGVRVPEEALNKPVLLDRKSTIFGYNKRYATDGGNLAQSVTEGETFVDLRLRTPAMNTGGVIMVTVEIVPDQLFERQFDPYLFASSTSHMPSFVRDFGDPEKVSIVKNTFVDVRHTDGGGTFGYAPLNHQWRRNAPNIGGKYYRNNPLAGFNENRQKIWAVETVDPSLTEDFYIVGDMHHSVFADSSQPPFEITATGSFMISGHTVFGKGLEENNDDYSIIQDQIPIDRIDQD